MIPTVLAGGVGLDLRDGGGGTALHKAVEVRNKESISDLLEAGISMDALDDSGLTALSYACRLGLGLDLVSDLILYGCDVTITDITGWAPLHHAAATGDCELAAALIYHGAELDACTDGGETALHIAGKRGRSDMVTFLASSEALELSRSNIFMWAQLDI